MLFRFTLTNPIKGSFRLQRDPKGWKGMEAIIKRGIEYHGTFYETMVQLEFACGSGKEYIDDVYDTEGVDGKIEINISIACNASGGVITLDSYSDDYSDDYGGQLETSGQAIFETFYEGVLDLSTYRKTERSTLVDVIQSDFIQKVINRFETQVEITKNESLDSVALAPISGLQTNFNYHPKEILLQTEFESISDLGDTLNVVFPVDFLNIEIPNIILKDEITGAVENQTPYTFSGQSGDGPRGVTQTEPFFVNTGSETLNITLDFNIVGTLSVRHAETFTGNFNLWFQNYGISFEYVPVEPEKLQTINGITFTAGVAQNIAVNTNGQRVFTLPPGEKIFITFGISDVPGDNTIPKLFEFLSFNASTFLFRLTTTSLSAPTTGTVFKIHEFATAICQRITSLEDCFRSELLGRRNSAPVSYDENGCASFTSITNGKLIRGFTTAQSPMFSSMKDFFKTVNSLWNVGLGFERIGDDYILRMEGKEYFYNTDVIHTCDRINKINESIAKEYYYTGFFLGFQKWEIENLNGLDEFNSKREYDTGIKALVNKVDLRSEYIASMYAIEFTRRQAATSTDWKYDSDNFIIATNRGVDGSGNPNALNVAEKDENFISTSGFRSPETSYNIRLSPVRSLLRHLKSIYPSLIKSTNKLLKFVYGEGNFIASTQISGTCDGNFDNEILIENQDIEADTVTPLWIPEYVEFEYPLSFADYLKIKNDPYKCIEYSTGIANFGKGFIVEIRYKPVGGLAFFKLLKAWQ